MSDSSKTVKRETLDVYLHDNLIGYLSTEAGNLSFEYDKQYLNSEQGAPISNSLPLASEVYDHEVVYPFFTGLLPDEAVKARLARYLRLSEKNTFALLKEIGGDCAGAISLYPKGSGPLLKKAPTYRVLTEFEADDLLLSLDKKPFLAADEDIRISGAGAQNKMMVSFVDGRLAIPTGSTPSTHIIKPAISGLEESVQNEYFCMKLAKRVGFNVPNVDIYWVLGKPYYLVERYDREEGGTGLVKRLHQEDFCQALHIPPEMKYENEGGPSALTCFNLLKSKIRSGMMPGKSLLSLFDAIVFNYVIGNGDAHGKNFSILYAPGSGKLAPLYDLLSTIIYGNAFKSKMAMKIGGKYKFADIKLRHIEKLAEEVEIRPNYARKRVKNLKENIKLNAQELSNELNKDKKTRSPVYDKICDVIGKHCRALEE